MRAGIIQPNYLPWRGYFDFIDDVDIFIFLDTVQYTKGDWRNRNRIKTPAGVKWLTVPVQYSFSSENNRITDIAIDYSSDWVASHMGSLKAAYSDAPYFNEYAGIVFEILMAQIPGIGDLDKRLCAVIAEMLGIKTIILSASDIEVSRNGKTQYLVDLLKHVGADVYLSGSSADEYLDKDLFLESGISLEYKSYNYSPYPQLHGPYAPDLSIVDLLFNCGPDARKQLKSKVQNQKIF